MNKINLLIPFGILLLAVLGCFSEKRDAEMVRGRLKFVESEYMGSAGGHGYGRGWIAYKRQFYFNGKKWSPEDFDTLKEINRCEPSPNEAVEAFRCYGGYIGEEVREAAYVLRIKNDQPEWTKVMDAASVKTGGHNFGEWFGDGKWLIFADNFYNIETGERRAIKPLPVYPDASHFRAVSPDLKTIVYQYIGCTDERGNRLTEPDYLKVCEKVNDYNKDKIEIVWLIDADTGAPEHLELKREKYSDLFDKSIYNADKFQKNLVWKKDETGRDRLVYPK